MKLLGYQLTPELSRQAYTRDLEELEEAFSPRYVEVLQQTPPEGHLGLLRVTVNAPSYVLTGETDTQPKPVSRLHFYIAVPEDYPALPPRVFFPKGSRLAHVNTFRTGTQCIDQWGCYSSLKSVAEKTVRAVIFDEQVTKYESPACTALAPWQKKMAAQGKFPTLNPPDLILRRSPGRGF